MVDMVVNIRKLTVKFSLNCTSTIQWKFLDYCILSLLITSIFIDNSRGTLEMTSNEKLVSVEFEIFGRVQGVFFRKYTEKEANRLGLKGWCMNTPHQNTVKGIIEGNPSKVGEMKKWLQTTGSPASRIDKAVFINEKNIPKYSYDSFQIKR